jgi:deoxyribose-phosphate aldolase
LENFSKIRDILKTVDHTLLSQTAVFSDIKKLCDEAIEYKTASVCIPPSYVKQAKCYAKDNLKICTVVGFPNGYNTTNTKIFETNEALENGANEIDMVINIGWLKDKEFSKLGEEIGKLKSVCKDKILKVIIETCLLSLEEKIAMCKIVSESGADYIKTSTGFSKSGASLEDIELFSKNIGNGVKIKAAGGIDSLKTAEEFINAGAARLGSSKIVALAKEYGV